MAYLNMTNTRRQLQKECSRALEDYTRIMHEGCAFLGEIQEGSITEKQKENLFSNRKRQLLARDMYDGAQRRLWRFLSQAAPPARFDNAPEPKINSKEQSIRHGPEKDQRIG
jgi:hypothetical protein